MTRVRAHLRLAVPLKGHIYRPCSLHMLASVIEATCNKESVQWHITRSLTADLITGAVSGTPSGTMMAARRTMREHRLREKMTVARRKLQWGKTYELNVPEGYYRDMRGNAMGARAYVEPSDR